MNHSNKNINGFHHWEMIIWLALIFIFVGIFLTSFLHKQHNEKMLMSGTNISSSQETRAYADFWKTLNLRIMTSNGRISVQQQQIFQDNFFEWAGVTISPNNQWILLASDGTVADPKGLICFLNHYDPSRPFIKPVCHL